ncbi:unnamed protein product [Ambrosiozyma monospora]|uniref:Unnamed protein product n=1 Tax=Ambrosiozyma monospora TaxID=43982 RepID=A0A9W6T964_AMBMO|nr:unnamed protein product [Ambrosiozyma monospora]
MLHLYQQNPQLCLRYGESFYDTIKQIFQRYINNEIAVLALIFDVLLRFKPSEEAKSKNSLEEPPDSMLLMMMMILQMPPAIFLSSCQTTVNVRKKETKEDYQS